MTRTTTRSPITIKPSALRISRNVASTLNGSVTYTLPLDRLPDDLLTGRDLEYALAQVVAGYGQQIVDTYLTELRRVHGLPTAPPPEPKAAPVLQRWEIVGDRTGKFGAGIEGDV